MLKKIHKTLITPGVYWLECNDADLRILCGCPADSVKHLIRMGMIACTEDQGVSFETGPNAILLSDTMLQQGSFANMAEFPVMQMLYKQGMLIPNHPNNTGVKPLLLGSEEQLQSQMAYIFRGNYGLVSTEELMDAGVSAVDAEDMMRMKLKFAFGNIRPTEEILDACVIAGERMEVRNGVHVQRVGLNRFVFDYDGEQVNIDLNLKPGEMYQPAYALGFHNIKRQYFSVIHSGEGDGWDTHRPSMSSILLFHGKIYLIDAGPNLLEILTALGIGINEVEGIFHTHSHDDHFAGLPALIQSDRRMKYYATKLVRASVTKKLSALVSIDEDHFTDYFEVHDLDFDGWNDVDGLEVKPIFSPHPVETNIFIFRSLGEGGYKSYAHYADITSFRVLDAMLPKHSDDAGVSQSLVDTAKQNYLLPATLKKIDVGGGLIHGDAADFKGDASDTILLAHTSLALSDKQKEIGSDAPFGMIDELIPTYQDYGMRRAYYFLQADFQTAPKHQLRTLLNNETLYFNPGSIIIKDGVVNTHLYLVLAGMVEMIDSRHGSKVKLYAGSLLGELSALQCCPATHTYRSEGFVQVLQISSKLYADFIKLNDLYGEIERLGESWQFLENMSLFNNAISHVTLNRIVQNIVLKTYPANHTFDLDGRYLYLIKHGCVEIGCDHVLERIPPGGFFGETPMFLSDVRYPTVQTLDASEIYQIPADVIKHIPIVNWKLYERHEKRRKLFACVER